MMCSWLVSYGHVGDDEISPPVNSNSGMVSQSFFEYANAAIQFHQPRPRIGGGKTQTGYSMYTLPSFSPASEQTHIRVVVCFTVYENAYSEFRKY